MAVQAHLGRGTLSVLVPLVPHLPGAVAVAAAAAVWPVEKDSLFMENTKYERQSNFYDKQNVN